MPRARIKSKLSDAIPNPGPGMFVTKDERLSIARAYCEVREFLREYPGEQPGPLRRDARSNWLPALRHAVRHYLANRDYDRRSTFSDMKSEAQRLKRSLTRLLKDLEKLPRPLIIALNNQMRAYEDGPVTKDRLSEVKAANLMLIKGCEPIAGRRNKKGGPVSVEKACASLWALREGMTQRAFVRQWKMVKAPPRLADKRGRREFIGLDALFVQVVLRAVDPDVTVAQIRTGLKRVAAMKSRSG